MRKKLLFGACAALFLGSGIVIAMRNTPNAVQQSDMILQSVEAMAQDENLSNLNWGKHPCPGAWFFNGSERCCISGGEGNNCFKAGECTGC